MSAHTPGPWIINGRAIEQDSKPQRDASVVAYVEDEQNDDHSANARLIAAAPALLAALEELVAGLSHGSGRRGDDVLADARAAIALARGGK